MLMLSSSSFEKLNKKLIAEIRSRDMSCELEEVREFVHCTDLLLASGQIKKTVAINLLETVTGYRSIDPNMISFSGQFLERMSLLLPKKLLESACVFPLKHEGTYIHLAMSNPLDTDLIKSIEVVSGSKVLPYCCSSSFLQKAIEKIYPDVNSQQLDDIEYVTKQALAITNEYMNLFDDDIVKLLSNPYIIILFRMILQDTVSRGISDLHFESQENMFRIRVRQDGVLREAWTFPDVLGVPILARIKMLAELKIENDNSPQDGRISNNLIDDKDMDIRVSVIRAIHGEKIVLRILDKGKDQLSLEDLQLDEVSSQRIQDAISQPNGMFLMTGPTGSGKTTTLYAILQQLNTEGVNISTAEDPVEYDLKGITQISCTEKDSTTFQSALKSFLRQDPDIIMVGEIRDVETADIATKAALTGHLMLSTLHTNDAASSITRLLNIGIPDYVLAACNLTIVAQRLLRKVCLECCVSYQPDVEVLEQLSLSSKRFSNVNFYKGEGCDACSNTGYHGRMCVLEVLTVDSAIEKLIVAGAGVSELNACAIDNGMVSLRENALRKLEQGLTTCEEVIRVTAD